MQTLNPDVMTPWPIVISEPKDMILTYMVPCMRHNTSQERMRPASFTTKYGRLSSQSLN